MSEISTNLDAARERLKEQARDSTYLTIAEAAALARCDPKTLRRAHASGALEALRPAQRLLFREADVRDWIESHPARPTPARETERRPTASRSKRRSAPKPAAPGSVQALREIQRNLRQ